MNQVTAADSKDVTEGNVLAVTLDGKPVGLTRVNGTVQAFVNKCPHLGMKLTKGKIEAGVITCPFHGSQFDLCTGADKAWVSGFMGMPLPEFMKSLVGMGKAPQGLQKLPASESGGKVFITFS